MMAWKIRRSHKFFGNLGLHPALMDIKCSLINVLIAHSPRFCQCMKGGASWTAIKLLFK